MHIIYPLPFIYQLLNLFSSNDLMQNLVSYSFILLVCSILFSCFNSLFCSSSLTHFLLPFLPPCQMFVVFRSTYSPAPLWLYRFTALPLYAPSSVTLMSPHLSDISLFWFSYNVNEIFQALFNGDSNRCSFWLLIHCDVWLRYPIGDH